MLDVKLLFSLHCSVIYG